MRARVRLLVVVLALGNGCGSSRTLSKDSKVADGEVDLDTESGVVDSEVADLSVVADSLACQVGMTKCAGTCVDLKTNPKHCGACDQYCPGTFICEAGKCVCSGCGPGHRKCGGKCVNVQIDLNNCGTCSFKCTGSDICVKGTCGCPAKCGSACVNLQIDKNNCGQCGNKCHVSQTCEKGLCGLHCDCASPLVDCSGTCVDLASDNSNCGWCGNKCTGGQFCSEYCCKCTPPMVLCSGTCVNLMADEKNCGMCGNKCAVGQLCENGFCNPIPPSLPTITCPTPTLPVGDTMLCSANGVLPSGATVNLTNVVTWSAVNNGPCVGMAGTISNGLPSTPPKGTFSAVTAGCKSDVSATHAPPGQPPVKSNVITVMVTK